MRLLAILTLVAFMGAVAIIIAFDNDMQKLRNDYQAYSTRPMLDAFPELPVRAQP